ncbi:protein of unknown function [Streptantibioticus cattleyicolor NRRL 8057 = DSM 46488]|nr:protein of unknown function [Streptantibioticus cattleyicolor NRRL 8057 = DSM 46488]
MAVTPGPARSPAVRATTPARTSTGRDTTAKPGSRPRRPPELDPWTECPPGVINPWVDAMRYARMTSFPGAHGPAVSA